MVFVCCTAAKNWTKLMNTMKNPALIFFVFLFLLGGCGGMPIQKIPLGQAPDSPFDAEPAPIGFNKIRYAIPTGAPVLSQSIRGVTGIMTCETPFTMVQAGITGRTFVNDRYKIIFRDAMEALGYDVTGDPGIMFDEREDIARTTYSIGARVVDLKLDVCKRKSFVFGYYRGYDGEATIEVEWTVFDLLHRKTVYKTRHKGYAKLNSSNFEGIDLLIENAFTASAHNLGADETFHDLVFFGIEPSQSGDYENPFDDRPRGKFDPHEELTIDNPPLFSPANKADMKELRQSVVMIEAGGSHGSGFFITDKGHILTNYHVVGHAARVRVVTFGQKEKLIAEVLRIDPRRDVALLRLEELPDDLDIEPLPIRLDKPEVSSDIYAVGAPRLRKLQDTISKGIVSAHRYDKEEKQDYIQGDVDVHGGNSGGPLLDEYGNIAGISVSGYHGAKAGTSVGLNFFIPIKDALAQLDIGIVERGENHKPHNAPTPLR